MAALSEIGDTSGRDVMEIDTSVLQKLLAALNECTEWGQVRGHVASWRMVCGWWFVGGEGEGGGALMGGLVWADDGPPSDGGLV